MLERGGFEGDPRRHDGPPVAPRAVDDGLPRRRPPRGRTTTARRPTPRPTPKQGINAADAITVAQTAIGLLRQHIRPSDRIHGIVTHGGDAPNIVPAETTSSWYVRSRTLAELAELEPRVQRCFEAGALATGCTMEVALREPALLGDDGRTRSSAPCTRPTPRPAAGSSRPSCRPRWTAHRRARPTWPTSRWPSRPSTPCSASTASRRSTISPSSPPSASRPVADRAVLDGAVAMAWTAIDAATTPACATAAGAPLIAGRPVRAEGATDVRAGASR